MWTVETHSTRLSSKKSACQVKVENGVRAVAMMGRVCWIAFVVCFFIACQEVGADDADEQRNANNAATGRTTTCSQLCRSFGVENGCAYAPRSVPKEEVIFIKCIMLHVWPMCHW